MTRRATRLSLALTCSMVTLAAVAASGVDPAAGTGDAAAASMLGFSPTSAAAQRALEQRFDPEIEAMYQ